MNETPILVEIVARAACDAEKGSGYYDHERTEQYTRELWMDRSDAALTALRDPPAHVIEAGARAIFVDGPYREREWEAMDNGCRQFWRDTFTQGWRAALDATPADPPACPAVTPPAAPPDRPVVS